MLRLAEIGLFLVPFGLFLSWWVASRRASRALVWCSLILLVAMGGIVITYGLDRALPRDVAYVPARLDRGRIVPGHGAE